MTVWRTAAPDARLEDSDGVQPEEVTFDAAQAAANFAVFEPGRVSEDCRIAEVTLRPERPPSPTGGGGDGSTDLAGNPCSLRVVLDGDGRRLRLKQFCYDWAPPAASVAPLWRTDRPTPFECADAVGWLGTDYKDNRGACVQRARTQVEASVTEGAFEDEEIQQLLSSLTPLETDAAAAVRSVPFHRLAYGVRYRCPPPGPPHGLWDHAPVRPYHECDPVSPAALGECTPTALVPPRDGDFRLDSAVRFPAAGAVECVFRRRANGNDHLWLTAATPESPLAPALPPDPSDQPAAVREPAERRGTTVHYAALTAEYGAWEAFWTENGVRYAAWAGASQYLDGDAFLALVDSLGPASERGSE